MQKKTEEEVEEWVIEEHNEFEEIERQEEMEQNTPEIGWNHSDLEDSDVEKEITLTQ